MKEGLRSGNPLGKLEKDRVPSGGRKKGDGTSVGNSSGKQKVFESKKEKKRPQLIRSDSDKDLPISRRGKIGRGNRDSNGTVARKNSEDSFEHKGEIETDRKRIRSEPVKCRAPMTVGRNDFVEAQNEKKSRMDVFEYNEDDMVDIKKTGTEIVRSRVVGSKPRAPSDKRRAFETEYSRSITPDKRKHSNFDRNGGADLSDKKRLKMKNDGTFRPTGSLKEKSGVPVNKSIRVQGRNGVLKVMTNSKKKVGGSEKTYGHQEAEENGKNTRSAGSSNRNIRHRPSFYSEKKFREKAGSSMVTDKKQVNSRKISSTKNIKASQWRTEDSDMSMQPGSENLDSCSSKKETRIKQEATLTSELCLPDRHKKGERRCGGGTKKQLIRGQIREFLVNAGWTVDLRPRRNRNYMDSVYISPSGNSYWSIVNAFYAFQKQYKNEKCDDKLGGTSSSFTPIPEAVLGQLTRKTRKKIERERMMKDGVDGGNKIAKETAIKRSTKNKRVKNQKSTPLSNKLGYGNEERFLHDQGDSPDTSHKRVPKPARVLASNANSLEGRKNKKPRGRALLVRSFNKEMIADDDDDYIPYNGKRTILTWLIDSGAVPLNGKVKYMNKRHTRTMLEGWITGDGIHCRCCSNILAISKFEIHAGSKLCQPFQNIFVETGASLLQCQVDAWSKQEEYARRGFYSIDVNSEDPNDDTCGICGDGGDLICCDGCPSTFHQSCLDIQVLPPGDWHCLNCSCKFCGVVGGSNGYGDDITISKLLKCSLCEEKYHGSCIEQINAVPDDSNSLCVSFCGLKCRELFEQLQKLLGVEHELEEGYTWTLIQRADLDSDASLLGLPEKAECNSKLAVALTVMDECFLPIFDRRSGVNLIHNVLYNCGSNFNRLNYSGFYTAILERGDEIISAASIRIHGTRLAEMPFIGTRHIYRRQGMCRRLLNAIESALCSLNVEKLIIPAISELMHTWTVVFGFKPLEKSHKQEMRSMNMLVFPGVDLLQKRLTKHNLSEGSLTGDSVVKVIELKSSHRITPEMTNKSDMVSSVRPEIIASDETVDHHAHGISDKVAAVETGLQAPGYSIHDTSDVISNSSDHPHGTILHAHGEETVCYNFHSQDKFPESALATESLQSVVTHVRPEAENKSIVDSPVDPNIQSSIEGATGDANDVNVGIASVEPDLHSSDEILIKHTSDVVSERPDAISGTDFLATDGNILKYNPDLNHQDTCDEESMSVEVSHPESDATHCEEIILHASGEGAEHDACKAKTEVTAVEPDLHVSDEGYLHCSTDSQLLQKLKCGFDAADTVPDSNEVRTEVAATEHNSQALSEDLEESVTKMVGESLHAASECNYSASTKCRNDDLVPSSCNFSSDVAVHTALGEAHNTNDLADESFTAIPGDSSCHASAMANMLDTCKEEVGVASVDPNQHAFGQASVQDSLDATSEPTFLASSKTTRRCNSELLHKLTDFTVDLAQNVFHGEVQSNHPAFGGGNAHDIHDLKGEVAVVEPNAPVLDENL